MNPMHNVGYYYTHQISWREYHEFLQTWVEKSFKTVEDCVQSHYNSICSRSNTKDIQIFTL